MESNNILVRPDKNILKVTMTLQGQTISAIGELPEVVIHSNGPMSLYSACMSLVQELSQDLYKRAREKQWNGLSILE
jgi:hypothetical protein